MAIKHSKSKFYQYDADIIVNALRNPSLCKVLETELSTEEKKQDGVYFLFVKKTRLDRWGRNYEVLVTDNNDGTSYVRISVQSRKVTVLIDPSWEKHADSFLNHLDFILENSADKN